MFATTKRLVTHATFIWFVSCVDSHVTDQRSRLTKHLATHVTFVRFHSTMNSAVSNKVCSLCKSFATNSTLKRFLSWMTSSVCCQVMTTFATFATFCARVFTSMNIHMLTKTSPRWKTFLTLSTWIQVFSSVFLSVNIQTVFPCKPFVTHCTQIRPCLVIMWMISETRFICTIYTTKTIRYIHITSVRCLAQFSSDYNK